MDLRLVTLNKAIAAHRQVCNRRGVNSDEALKLQIQINDLRKAWSEEAREAAAAARAKGAEHANKMNDSWYQSDKLPLGDEKQRTWDEGVAHSHAMYYYNKAADHYDKGEKEKGDKEHARGEKLVARMAKKGASKVGNKLSADTDRKDRSHL